MMSLLMKEKNFEIYGDLSSGDLFSLRIVKTDVFHHFRKYEEVIQFIKNETPFAKALKIQTKPKTYEIRVKYFQGQNYTAADVMRCWSKENHTPLFYGHYGDPYLRLYGANYYYDSWKVQKNNDDTEISVITLKRIEE